MDKEKGEYAKRTEYTVAPFPELNSESLGLVFRWLNEGIRDSEFQEKPEQRAKLEKLIQSKDFPKLYAFSQIEAEGKLNRESLDGQWVIYPQNSDHHILEQSLANKSTGWCTATGSAYAHLQGGDFHVFYSKGSDGAFTANPAIAIRMEGDQVAEVRGVNHRQELEPALVETADSSTTPFPVARSSTEVRRHAADD